MICQDLGRETTDMILRQTDTTLQKEGSSNNRQKFLTSIEISKGKASKDMPKVASKNLSKRPF